MILDFARYIPRDIYIYYHRQLLTFRLKRGPVVASTKDAEQSSTLGGSGGIPPGKSFVFNNAKCYNQQIKAIITFFQAPPPWKPLCIL